MTCRKAHATIADRDALNTYQYANITSINAFFTDYHAIFTTHKTQKPAFSSQKKTHLIFAKRCCLLLVFSQPSPLRPLPGRGVTQSLQTSLNVCRLKTPERK
jgi:hypothetical protein